MRTRRPAPGDRLGVRHTRILLVVRRAGMYQGDIDRLAALSGLTVNYTWQALIGLHALEHITVGRTGTMLKVKQTQSGRRARLAWDHTRR